MLVIDSKELNVGRQISWLFRLAIFCCLFYKADGQVKENGLPDHKVSSSKETMELLEKLSSEEVTSSDSFLGKTRFAIDFKAHSFLYDSAPVPAGLVLSNSDPLAVPLEAMIRIEALQRDLKKSLLTEKFWIGPVANVQVSVKKCVESLAQVKDNSAVHEKENDCSVSIEEKIRDLDQSIETFTKDRALIPTQPAVERSPAIGYKVQVSIGPPKARVRFMTLLEYRKCTSSKSSLTDQWNDLFEGDINLIGRYHYLAEWPPDLNGPEEGNFEIRKPGTVTFRPNAK